MSGNNFDAGFFRRTVDGEEKLGNVRMKGFNYNSQREALSAMRELARVKFPQAHFMVGIQTGDNPFNFTDELL